MDYFQNYKTNCHVFLVLVSVIGLKYYLFKYIYIRVKKIKFYERFQKMCTTCTRLHENFKTLNIHGVMHET